MELSIEQIAKLQCFATIAAISAYGDLEINTALIKGSYNACLQDLKVKGAVEKQLETFDLIMKVK